MRRRELSHLVRIRGHGTGLSAAAGPAHVNIFMAASPD